MGYALVFFPLAMASLLLAVPSNRLRPWLLPPTGAIHLALFAATVAGGRYTCGSWLALDPPGRLVLGVSSLLFFLCSFYAVGYLRHRSERRNRVFCACLAAMLGVTSLVAWSRHLGLMWVAMEATTLVTAPLIYFNRNARSIEATWKYLMICSVGIALALLGSFFLAYASLREGLSYSLLFDDLLRQAPRLSEPWLHAAFVLVLVGYGTKMGLAPMHTWKPDAYGEAPGVVGALLAGCMANCGFLAILRIFQVCRAAGDAEYARTMLLGLGFASMGAAAVFLARQKDLKRMLAYSSVEHMGILAVGLGLGGAGTFGALLHLVNNGLTKGVLFLSAGNLHRAYGSKRTDEVRGAFVRLPATAGLFLAGFLAIAGSPPFGPFLSKLTILDAAVSQGSFVAAGLFTALLVAVFVGMASTVLTAVQGTPPEPARSSGYRDRALTVLPIVVALGLVLLLGVYLPPPLEALLREAARFVEA
ncbi:MAG: hydrogenase [Deltaproteobacteria bacterium]|nr:hydrogenase [Deltaproteobacteria bacterium]